MSTISKDMAIELIKANGKFEDDPQAFAIIYYRNVFFDNKPNFAVVHDRHELKSYTDTHPTMLLWEPGMKAEEVLKKGLFNV